MRELGLGHDLLDEVRVVGPLLPRLHNATTIPVGEFIDYTTSLTTCSAPPCGGLWASAVYPVSAAALHLEERQVVGWCESMVPCPRRDRAAAPCPPTFSRREAKQKCRPLCG